MAHLQLCNYYNRKRYAAYHVKTGFRILKTKKKFWTIGQGTRFCNAQFVVKHFIQLYRTLESVLQLPWTTRSWQKRGMMPESPSGPIILQQQQSA